MSLTVAAAQPALANEGWTQRGQTIEGAVFNDFVGATVSLSGDGSTWAVSRQNGGNGSVAIYSWDGNSWVPKGTSIAGADVSFGYSTSLSDDGNSIAIGNALDDVVVGGQDRGAVKVFDWDGTSWVQRGTDITGTSDNQQLGWSVSMSADGTIVAIGAPGDATQGRARVFGWSGGAWTQLGADLQAPAGGSASDQFGYSVSVSSDGGVLAVTAPGINRAWAFDWDGSSWTARATPITFTAGTSIALSGDASVVALRSPDVNAEAKTYTWNGANWDQRGSTFTLPGPESSISGIALSEDGSIVAIDGWPVAYEWSGSEWVQKGDVVGGGPPSGLGAYSVALSANGLIFAVGAPETSGLDINTGAAAVFQWPSPDGANGVPGPATYFTFLLPDGRECSAISPMQVQVGVMVELPGVDALCQTMPGSSVAGWTIPVPHGFTGYGSSFEPFPPGLRVRVSGSQRFTVVTFEPVLQIDYDANIAARDSCVPADLVHTSNDGRVEHVWVPREDFAMARTPAQAPCVPEGHQLTGWNTAGDGSGETLAPGAPLPTGWADGPTNHHHLYAMWSSN